MDTRTAKQLTGGLAQTTKMPCPSWSIPVSACKTGGRLAKVPGSTCSTCYAAKGNYHRFKKTIEPALQKRLDLADGPNWVEAMTALISNYLHFRWFDSGDLQDVAMLERIAEVARRTPQTRHWLPTREYGIVKQYVTKHGKLPDNLMVRLSASMLDQEATLPASLQGHPNIRTSTVYTKYALPPADYFVCPAYTGEQKGQCGSCRACWSKDVETVTYRAH